jgi:hypothetical protein
MVLESKSGTVLVYRIFFKKKHMIYLLYLVH